MWITIDKESAISLIRQIYTQLKNTILQGELQAGTRLPSTRTLAAELQVSRNTILEVYNQLLAEGYLTSRVGSGTIVASGILPLSLPTPAKASVRPDNKTASIDFRSGVPDLVSIPITDWGRLYHTLCTSLPHDCYRYQDILGLPVLREVLASYLSRTRGLTCNPNNLVITSGSTQALSLIAKLLYTPNSNAIVEDPTHPGLTGVITNEGFSLLRVSADEQGMNPAFLPDANTVRLIYTTPSHQYPLGSVLSIQRRQALLSYAEAHHCYVVEDDYDSEFRYEGIPIQAMYELNPARVIYIGSFSKILAPALRLGYAILPDELLTAYKHVKLYDDVHTDILSQYTLSRFIADGLLEKHIWKMKKLYTKKRHHLIQTLTNHFGDTFTVLGQSAGLHILLHFDNIEFDAVLLSRLRKRQVKVYPLSDYVFLPDRPCTHDILLGYAHLSFAEMEHGVAILSEELHTYAV